MQLSSLSPVIIRRAGKTSPPVIHQPILQAEADDVVLLSDAFLIKDSLEERGIEHELVVIQGATHDWYGKAGEEGFDAIVEFLKSYLSPSGP